MSVYRIWNPRHIVLLLTIGIVILPSIVLAQQKPESSQKHALIIGVSAYKHSNLNRPKLNYPEVDAKALADLLAKSGYQVNLLLGIEATGERIKAELEKVAMQGTSEGAVLIGVIGHGIQIENNAWFCPYDTGFRKAIYKSGLPVSDENGDQQIEPDPETMISLSSLLDSMRLCAAKNRIILADCCRNDPLATRDLAFGSNLKLADLPNGTVTIFACSKGEKAYEHSSWGHGAFIRTFLDCVPRIHSQSGAVGAGTLADNLKAGVSRLVGKFGQTQTVNVISNGTVDLMIGEIGNVFKESKWDGKVGNLPLSFRWKERGRGELTFEQSGVPTTFLCNVVSEGERISINCHKAIRGLRMGIGPALYEGKLTENKISGNWHRTDGDSTKGNFTLRRVVEPMEKKGNILPEITDSSLRQVSLKDIGNLDVDRYSRAMLFLAFAEAVDRRKQDSTKIIQLALNDALAIRDTRQAMECSFQIAKLVASRKNLDLVDAKSLHEALKQVKSDVAALKQVRNGKWSGQEITLAKYLTQIRSAALYWKAGQKKLADEANQLAFPKSSSANFYYDLPVFQAIQVFAESGDLSNIAKFQHIQNGEIRLNENKGSRPYISLLDGNLFQSRRHGERGDIYQTILNHAELAKSYGIVGKLEQSRIHYRAAQSFVDDYSRGEPYDNWVRCEAHGRLAITEAIYGDFLSARRRIENDVKREAIRGEAAYQLCLRQLATSGDTRGGGIEGALTTIEAVKKEPMAVMLAFEIAKVYQRIDAVKSIQWVEGLSSPLKEAAMIGLESK